VRGCAILNLAQCHSLQQFSAPHMQCKSICAIEAANTLWARITSTRLKTWFSLGPPLPKIQCTKLYSVYTSMGMEHQHMCYPTLEYTPGRQKSLIPILPFWQGHLRRKLLSGAEAPILIAINPKRKVQRRVIPRPDVVYCRFWYSGCIIYGKTLANKSRGYPCHYLLSQMRKCRI
jgi:hypothetical protein